MSVDTVAILTAHPGKMHELETLLLGMVSASRAESGNRRYDLYRDHSDTNRFVLDETYSDEAAVASHHATPHFQHYLTKINGLADRVVVTLVPLNVA